MFFFFNDTATTEIYTLSLHDALPIYACTTSGAQMTRAPGGFPFTVSGFTDFAGCEVTRSEEHTSELQSQSNLVCRLLLEKKRNTKSSIRVRAVRSGALSLPCLHLLAR